MELNYINNRILIDPLTMDDASLDNFVLIGGFVDLPDMETIANSYKDRADDLVKIATKNKDLAYEYTFPILYLYRHSLELYLKNLMTKNTHGHKFEVLIENLKRIGGQCLQKELLDTLILRINEFKEIDNRSTRFRYGQELNEEFLINLNHLRLIFSDMVLVINSLRDVK